MRSRSTGSNRSDYPSFSGPSYGQMMGSGVAGAEANANNAVAVAAAATRPFLRADGVRVNGGGSGGVRDKPDGAAEEVAERDRQTRHQRRERFLCCCCCALALGLLAVSGFLLLSYLPAFRPPPAPCAVGGAGGGGGSGGGSGGGGGADGGPAYCLSRACLKAAAEMEEMLNQTADPCADFFGFACDGWLADNHMPPTAAVWSRASRLQLATDGHLREMLESRTEGGGQPDEASSGWEPRLKGFYEACVSVEDPRLAQCGGGGGGGGGGAPSSDEFQSLLNACQGRRRLTDRILCLQVEVGVDTLFWMEPVQSPWAAGEHQILLLDQHRDWQLGDLSVPSEREGLRQLVIALVDDLEHLGDSVGKNYADSVLTVLQSLERISLPDSDPLKDEPLIRAQQFTVAEFRRELEKAGSLIQFDKLIAYFLFRNADADVDSMTVAVGNPSYFYRLGNLLKGLRDDDLKKYLEFCIIRKYSPYYSAKSRRDLLRHAARLNGQEHAEDDWLPCLRLIRSPGLNAIFYREMQARLQLDLVSGVLVPYLKEAFVELIRSTTYLSRQAKEAIVEKVKSMRVIVGYSEQHLESAYLDQFYRDWNGSANQSLLQMVSEWTRFQQTKVRARLRDNRHRIEESLDITSVYPRYFAAENTVFLPAAFFQWPFHLWDNTMPYYLKFAIIGSAIATEMARGFDSTGSRWPPDSRPRQPPPLSLLLLLTDEAADCMDTQLPTETPKSPSRASQAAFAAAWGLRVAEGAHRLYLRGSGRRQLSLPTLSYSAVEFLYIAFAQANCGYERLMMKHRLAKSYLPLRSRVQLAVQNDPAFSQAFRCKAAAPNCQLSRTVAP